MCRIGGSTGDEHAEWQAPSGGPSSNMSVKITSYTLNFVSRWMQAGGTRPKLLDLTEPAGASPRFWLGDTGVLSE